jgi:hypothetical protein
MLNWSAAQYKLTLGFGGLAMASMVFELRVAVPDWAAFAVGFLPLTLFLFGGLRALPAGLASFFHVFASVWYVAVGGGLLIVMAALGPHDNGWPFYPSMVTLGALPCLTVLWRVALGKYGAVESD